MQLFSAERHIGTQSTGLHEHKMHETCAKEAEKTCINGNYPSDEWTRQIGLTHRYWAAGKTGEKGVLKNGIDSIDRLNRFSGELNRFK